MANGAIILFRRTLQLSKFVYIFLYCHVNRQGLRKKTHIVKEKYCEIFELVLFMFEVIVL